MSKTVPYTTCTGLQQFKPTLEYATKLQENSEGFCLACSNTQDGVEPDARRYVCDRCGKPKVYGIEELFLMGLVA